MSHETETQVMDGQESPTVDAVHLDIIWDKATQDDWAGLYTAIPKTNIIQTFPYAKAMRDIRQQVTRFGVIHVNGAEAGLVQIQEIKLLGFIHFVFMDRGPLWFSPVNDEVIHAFFEKMNKDYPRRFGRKRRFIPELPQSDIYQEMMEKNGFTEEHHGYQSIWMDLSLSEEELRANLKSKWRNQLKRAEGTELKVVEDPVLLDLPWLVHHYMEDRMEKKYSGPSPKLIHALCHHAMKQGQTPLFLKALKGRNNIAGILVFVHGSSATYQVGWTGPGGRKTYAHNLLLWQAMLALKARGVKYFDLGGLNEDSAEGVARFKRGLGGEEYQLLGTFY